ncbi:MAG: hypothetical protein IPK20_22535 [Betaproteobacteria bacterium]|nr:hypothetical protein [Betaproteobacteria bacterium]
MPVTNDCAAKGRSTVSNSDTRVSGSALGMPASAAVNSGLVEGSGAGVGATPKFGGVVPCTVGRAPRLTPDPSGTAFTPATGASRLPATSVDSARNSYVWPSSPVKMRLPSAAETSRCQILKSPPSVARYSVRWPKPEPPVSSSADHSSE